MRKLDEIYIVLDRLPDFLISHDFGETWELKPFPNNASMNSMVFVDSLNGYAVGDSGKILIFNP